jgi:hypothetical protein
MFCHCDEEASRTGLEPVVVLHPISGGIFIPLTSGEDIDDESYKGFVDYLLYLVLPEQHVLDDAAQSNALLHSEFHQGR